MTRYRGLYTIEKLKDIKTGDPFLLLESVIYYLGIIDNIIDALRSIPSEKIFIKGYSCSKYIENNDEYILVCNSKGGISVLPPETLVTPIVADTITWTFL